MFRKIVGILMIAIFPAATMAQNNEAAMVYGTGVVQVNGRPMPAFTLAIFPGDSVETRVESTANINAPGASISLQPESVIKYGASAITLQRGFVSVVASKAIVVDADGISSVPASSTETEFEVFQAGLKIDAVAIRSDLNVTCRNGSFHLKEGEEVTRDEQGRCQKAAKTEGAALPDSDPILTNPWTWGTVGVVGGILCAFFCFPIGVVDPPMSAWNMNGK